MNRLFLRLFLLVVLATVAGTALTFSVLDLQLVPAENAALEQRITPGLERLAARLAAGEPEQDVLDEARRSVGDTLAVLPLDLLPLDDGQRQQLAAGRIVLAGSGLQRAAYVGIPDGRVVELELLGIRTMQLQWTNLPGTTGTAVDPSELQLSPLDQARLAWRPILHERGSVVRLPDGTLEVRDIARVQNIRELSMGLTALCLAIAVGVSLWPVRRELIALSDGAERLRQGDLTARVAVGARRPGVVGQVAVQFNAMADRVQALIESHEELLRSVSHEMQTPVSRLVFAIDALEGDPDQPALLEGMRQTADELRVLAEEVLEFNRLGGEGQPAIELAPVDLAELAEDVAMAYDGASTDATGPAFVDGDARLLYRALKNLVENAIAYGTPPVIRVVQDEANVLVHVDDAGPGIPAADRQRVFEPFVRVDGSRARRTGGTGLGLAIVDRIVQRHGGRCSVTDSPEQGARITLSLPRGRTPTAG